MRKKTSIPAFTLIELLVVISIIGILALWFSNINFSRLSQAQRVGIESAKIINLIEEARNNALIWKGVGVSLSTPDSWHVVLENTSSNGSMQVQYFDGILQVYESWNSPNLFSISNLECRNLEKPTPGSESVSTLTITFTWSVGWISGCSDNTYKTINFDYGVWNITQNITINTLSWVIEAD